jgi:hypothetical protein
MTAWDPEKDICARCKTTLADGWALKNEDIEKEGARKRFPYMLYGEGMHMECYIERVIDCYTEKKKQRKSK